MTPPFQPCHLINYQDCLFYHLDMCQILLLLLPLLLLSLWEPWLLLWLGSKSPLKVSCVQMWGFWKLTDRVDVNGLPLPPPFQFCALTVLCTFCSLVLNRICHATHCVSSIFLHLVLSSVRVGPVCPPALPVPSTELTQHDRQSSGGRG